MHRTEQDQQAVQGSLYRTLGLTKEASSEEIRQAYKSAVWAYHPDRPHGKRDAFEEANKAYRILSNKKHRVIYNIFGEKVIPLIQDRKLSVYIDKMLCRTTGVLFCCFLLLGYIGIIGYPYLSLLKRVNVPWIVVSIPAAVSIFLGWCTYASILQAKNRKCDIFSSLLKNFSIIFAIFSVSMYLDKTLSNLLLLLAYSLSVCLLLVGYIIDRSRSIDQDSTISKFYQVLLFFSMQESAIECLVLGALMGSFVLPQRSYTVYWGRISTPFIYIYLRHKSRHIPKYCTLFLCPILFLVIVPLAWAQKKKLIWYDILGLCLIAVLKMLLFLWTIFSLVNAFKRVCRRRADLFVLPAA